MTEETINRGALRQLMDAIGGGPDDLLELLDDYFETAPELAEAIATAAVHGDLNSLRIAAHTLKSNARDFGALRLSSLCATLEAECRAGAVANAAPRSAEILREEAEARRLLATLDANDLSR